VKATVKTYIPLRLREELPSTSADEVIATMRTLERARQNTNTEADTAAIRIFVEGWMSLIYFRKGAAASIELRSWPPTIPTFKTCAHGTIKYRDLFRYIRILAESDKKTVSINDFLEVFATRSDTLPEY